MGLHGRLSGGGTLRGRLRSASGGNTFTIQPVYNTGLKIADYEEDGEAGELYIPSDPLPVELYSKGFLVSNPSDIILSDSFENYNYLDFYFIKRDDNSYYDYLPIVTFTKEELSDCMNNSISGRTNVLNISGWQPGDQYVRMTIPNNTTLHIVRNDSKLLLHKIIGRV